MSIRVAGVAAALVKGCTRATALHTMQRSMGETCRCATMSWLPHSSILMAGHAGAGGCSQGITGLTIGCGMWMKLSRCDICLIRPRVSEEWGATPCCRCGCRCSVAGEWQPGG
jgi:hypothetical protein